MNKQMLIAGGGIGGLAAALAAARQGWDVRLYEQTPSFGEVGAGIQLGPNVTKIFGQWGLTAELHRVAAFPDRIRAFDACSGVALSELPLGRSIQARYGAPYATIHRAALHTLLLRAVMQEDGVWLNLGVNTKGFTEQNGAVSLVTETMLDRSNPAAGMRRNVVEGDVLVAADGLWSQVRKQMLGDGEPRPTGHLAYRGLVSQSALPARLRSNDVAVWLAPNLHAVIYPVGGDLLNVVVLVEGVLPEGDVRSWNHATTAAQLHAHMLPWVAPLRDLIETVPEWRLWPLFDREPMQGPHAHARGLVALLGDAAHPMLPYLAQGAGMAIEDAHVLAQALRMAREGVPLSSLLQHYALNRWARNARVQTKARRNGRIFHASGPIRWGRNVAMRMLGARLMDAPWLYQGQPHLPAR